MEYTDRSFKAFHFIFTKTKLKNTVIRDDRNIEPKIDWRRRKPPGDVKINKLIVLQVC